jgi:hypothetical protein
MSPEAWTALVTLLVAPWGILLAIDVVHEAADS